MISPSSSTALPRNFLTSPSLTLPTTFPFSSSTKPSLTTTNTSMPANGHSAFISRSSSGINLHWPMCFPESFHIQPFSSTFLPTSCSGVPSMTLPIGIPSGPMMFPCLFGDNPFRIDNSSFSGPGFSSYFSACPTTLPLLSRISPSGSTALPKSFFESP
ncbi:hypothetical protein ACKS0A_02542 [Histoplasma ohiense]